MRREGRKGETKDVCVCVCAIYLPGRRKRGEGEICHPVEEAKLDLPFFFFLPFRKKLD